MVESMSKCFVCLVYVSAEPVYKHEVEYCTSHHHQESSRYLHVYCLSLRCRFLVFLRLRKLAFSCEEKLIPRLLLRLRLAFHRFPPVIGIIIRSEITVQIFLRSVVFPELQLKLLVVSVIFTLLSWAYLGKQPVNLVDFALHFLDDGQSSKKEKKSDDHVEDKCGQDVPGNVFKKRIMLTMLSKQIQSLSKILLNVTVLVLDDLIDDNLDKFPDLDRRAMVNNNQIQVTQYFRIDLLLLDPPLDLLLKGLCHSLDRIVLLQKVVWICSIIVQVFYIELTL